MRPLKLLQGNSCCGSVASSRVQCRGLPSPNQDIPGSENSQTFPQRKGFESIRGEGWLSSAPQVRVRQAEDRARQQLGELALLNESLLGEESWRLRKKVEYLKSKREAWQGMYTAACRQDASLTVAHLEEAMDKVNSALREGADEYKSITAARGELLQLREDIEEAHHRLHITQARVEQNVQKLTELKAEADEFSGISSLPLSTGSTAHPEVLETVNPAPLQVSKELGVAKPRRSNGLKSSLTLEQGLRNFWYPVCFSSKLTPETLVTVDLFDQPWVLFRDEQGRPACVWDECAHRACPLSAGTVVDGKVQCPYHGWTFNSSGECVKMPSTVQCKGVKVSALPTSERDGFVWVWAGDSEPVQIPNNTLPPGSFSLHAEIEVEVPVEHGLLMENLLDLAHAPFTHTSTFAKGWPVPDAVRFHAEKMLGGNWDPYPIDMSFEPPCMVVSMIGLKQPGQIEAGARAKDCQNHLHQLHVCLPSRRGHTRLLYRMSLDFMPWVKHVPFIDMFWEYIAGQVLGEDLVLVKGQQDRMQRGGDTWRNPVSYDKLAVKYRRWRNSLPSSEKLPPSAYESQSMDAGDLFAIDDEAIQVLQGQRLRK